MRVLSNIVETMSYSMNDPETAISKEEQTNYECLAAVVMIGNP